MINFRAAEKQKNNKWMDCGHYYKQATPSGVSAAPTFNRTL